MVRIVWLAILLLAILTGCIGRGEGGAGPQLHTINIRVHPDDALVTVRNPQRVVIAVTSQRGPNASFSLPQGEYSYTVSADGYEPHEDRFSIPDNKNLEVWLQPN